MKITNVPQVDDFLKAVNKCKGEVYLRSPDGNQFNLKSKLSQYIALGRLLSEHGDELELFCQLREDEGNFISFFNRHPETL